MVSEKAVAADRGLVARLTNRRVVVTSQPAGPDLGLELHFSLLSRTSSANCGSFTLYLRNRRIEFARPRLFGPISARIARVSQQSGDGQRKGGCSHRIRERSPRRFSRPRTPRRANEPACCG